MDSNLNPEGSWSTSSAELEDALQWLLDTRMVHKVPRTEKVGIPLRSYLSENLFKLYMMDVGIMLPIRRMGENDNMMHSDIEIMKDVPIGNDDFKKIRENDGYYVDKSNLIEDAKRTSVDDMVIWHA